MTVLSIQAYEAIAAYDHENAPSYEAALILHPSQSGVWLFTYNKKGAPELLNSWKSDSAPDISPIVKYANESKPFSASINKAIRRYYKYNREIDPPVSELDTTAGELMESFRESVGVSLTPLFDSADAALNDLGISPSGLRILIVGALADYFPAEATVRLRYSSAMPMSPDPRYGIYSELGDIIKAGEAICARNKVKLIRGSVEWNIIQSKGDGSFRDLSLTLAKDGDAVESYSSCVYAEGEGVFAVPNDVITISIAGKKTDIPISDRLVDEPMALINVGLQCIDESFSIVLRECGSGRTQMYPIEIELKGD